MAEHTTYIKLDRNMMTWRWYKDDATKSLFIHILFKANVKSGDFRGITVKRGQLITSREKLAEETGLTIQQVRTGLNRLKSTNEITCETTNRYTLITVVNYNSYQDKSTNKLTNKQPTNNQQITIKQPQSKNNKKEDTNVSSKNEKKGADAPTPAAREWELRRNIPQDYWGVFPSEEFFDEWWLEHKCGT